MQTASRAEEPAPLCEIENLRIGFPAHDGTLTDAVRGISLTVQRGERLGIVGESGSGKSLTGRALLGLLPSGAQWSADVLRFEGVDLLAMRPGERRRLCGTQMSMILQDPKYSLNPVMTVAQQMREAFRSRGSVRVRCARRSSRRWRRCISAIRSALRMRIRMNCRAAWGSA
jgi:peptide/nickel transport system ATP-binding protein